MRIYSNKNVFETALDRIRYLFDEFNEVVVSFSGGKDSTVILNLALIVAKEKNRLPLKVFWLDQEIEWKLVSDYQKSVMYRPDVIPCWYQIPFKQINATSLDFDYLTAWEEKAREYRIIDNKIPESTKWLEAELKIELKGLDLDKMKDYFPEIPDLKLALSKDIDFKLGFSVTHDNISETDEKLRGENSLNERNDQNRKVEVICPHCFKEFYLNKDEI